jgi:hypothetical protein
MPIAPWTREPGATQPRAPDAPSSAGPALTPPRPESHGLVSTDGPEQELLRTFRSDVARHMDIAAYAGDPCGDGRQSAMSLVGTKTMYLHTLPFDCSWRIIMQGRLI